MFENLSNSLQDAFKNITGQGKLSESNIKDAMAQVRDALLEADVNYDIVDDFIKEAESQCLGEKVLRSVKPGEQAIKIVNDLLIELMGEEESPLELHTSLSSIMMVGLHGAGKTTTTAKLANYLKQEKNKKTLMVACDVYRPAAIDQLESLAKQYNLEVYTNRELKDVSLIALEAYKYAKFHGFQSIVFDMAGRLQIDTDMVEELIRVKKAINPQEILLTCDAALGQEAVSVAKHFDEALQITGIILTKLDGDARGGAALSMRKVTNRPIKFVTEGEKLEDLSLFYPKRMADRILGMGDIASMVDLAKKHIDEKEAEKLEEKIKRQTFDLNDFLDHLAKIKKMGGLTKLLKFLPGGQALKNKIPQVNPKDMKRTEGIIHSMTQQEREKPALINQSRRTRIAKGSGVKVEEVAQLLKRFNDTKKMLGSYANGNMDAANLMQKPSSQATKTKKTTKSVAKKKRKQQKQARKRNR